MEIGASAKWAEMIMSGLPSRTLVRAAIEQRSPGLTTGKAPPLRHCPTSPTGITACPKASLRTNAAGSFASLCAARFRMTFAGV